MMFYYNFFTKKTLSKNGKATSGSLYITYDGNTSVHHITSFTPCIKKREILRGFTTWREIKLKKML